MKESGTPNLYGHLRVIKYKSEQRDDVSRANITVTGENRPSINMVCDARYTCTGGLGYVKVNGRIIPL